MHSNIPQVAPLCPLWLPLAACAHSWPAALKQTHVWGNKVVEGPQVVDRDSCQSNKGRLNVRIHREGSTFHATVMLS